MNLRIMYAVRDFQSKTNPFTNHNVFEITNPDDIEIFLASKESINHILNTIEANLELYERINLLAPVKGLDVHGITREGEFDCAGSLTRRDNTKEYWDDFFKRSGLLNNLDTSKYKEEISWFLYYLSKGYYLYLETHKGVR